MVTVDDVLVDAFAAEVLQHLVDAVDAVKDGLGRSTPLASD